jgi:hypothetical protein
MSQQLHQLCVNKEFLSTSSLLPQDTNTRQLFQISRRSLPLCYARFDDIGYAADWSFKGE